MRIAVIPMDDSACGFYRMQLPAAAVQRARPDWQVDLYPPGSIQLGGDPAGLRYVKGINDLENLDLVVMQRVGSKWSTQFLEWCGKSGIATVLDSDDAMWAIDKENTAYASWNTKDGQHWRYTDEAASVADLVTVTTDRLAQRYARKHGRAEVLPNCVPAEVGDLEPVVKQEGVITIGWAGFTATHPRDLYVVGDAVRQVVLDTGCEVKVLGDAEGAMRAWGVPVTQIDPVPLGKAYYTALTALDVALVPLEDSTFNKAKSYLKALEFASVGVPVVASPTPANWALAQSVPIQLARTDEEWYNALRILVEDQDIRERTAAEGFKSTQTHHTYEANAERWAAAWERAITRRRMIRQKPRRTA